MYGVALHCDFLDGMQKEHRTSQFVQLPTARSSTALPDAIPVSIASISTISSCLVNVHEVMEAFLAMSADTMRSLPTFNYGRVVIACAMLFKLYIFVDQDSNLAAVIDKDQFGVGPCIDRLIRQFHAAAAGRCCRAATRLLAVLLVIKDSFTAYCVRKESEDRPKTNVQLYNPPNESPLSTSKQVWPLQQSPQHTNRRPITPAFAQGNTRASGQLPEFSGASSHRNTNGVGLPPWEVDFFAALSVEEFSYTLGLNPDGEGIAEYYDMGGNDPSPDISMGQDRLGDVELANMPSNSNGLDSTSWGVPMRFE
jgi:hypothetical protein